MAPPRPRLSTISDIGQKTLVRGTHGLSHSQYEKLLKHPETERIFREHGVTNVKGVLYSLRQGQKESVASLEQGRRIFRALKAVAGSTHAEDIRRSVGFGHKSDEQLLKEAERREGPSAEDLKKKQEQMAKRTKADRRQDMLYRESRARTRSSITEGAGTIGAGRNAKTSVLSDEHHSSVFDRPGQPKDAQTAAPPAGRPLELTGGLANLARPSNEPVAADEPLAPIHPKSDEQPAHDADDDTHDVAIPPPADDAGLPL